ncbi:MAG: hypothetical protein JKX93_06535 [Rhizobiaceae bacterium]|nr:hypothetical protein [Rhizobiaceae bacterium]MBL4695966.1 hypothetical protein [Rhizobiaceae bacterium]
MQLFSATEVQSSHPTSGLGLPLYTNGPLRKSGPFSFSGRRIPQKKLRNFHLPKPMNHVYSKTTNNATQRPSPHLVLTHTKQISYLCSSLGGYCMAGNPITALMKRKRVLISDIKTLQKELAEIDKVLNQAEKLAEKLKPRISNIVDDPSKRATPKEVVRITQEILNEVNIPMPRSKILQALKDRGIVIGGSNPANTLGTTLGRNKDLFINLDGYGYWLITRDCPQVSYYAKDQDSSDVFGPVALH